MCSNPSVFVYSNGFHLKITAHNYLLITLGLQHLHEFIWRLEFTFLIFGGTTAISDSRFSSGSALK